MKKEMRCAQFDSKNHCKNVAEIPIGYTYQVDFCAKHNHMSKTGIPVKCWKCGDN